MNKMIRAGDTKIFQFGSSSNNAPLLCLLEVPTLLELIFFELPPLRLDTSTLTLLPESARASVILTSLLDPRRELREFDELERWVASSRPDELDLPDEDFDEDLPDLSFDSMFILTMAPFLCKCCEAPIKLW